MGLPTRSLIGPAPVSIQMDTADNMPQIRAMSIIRRRHRLHGGWSPAQPQWPRATPVSRLHRGAQLPGSVTIEERPPRQSAMPRRPGESKQILAKPMNVKSKPRDCRHTVHGHMMTRSEHTCNNRWPIHQASLPRALAWLGSDPNPERRGS